ncbi:MAG: ribbon-helix-helix domain-containing protein [Halobacteriales archaeon]|nr:ribbon-helix-helix domain-containing protein [Halobacteriales archaeon]
MTLRLPKALLDELDLLVSCHEFDDRSSAIRQGIRELLDARRAKVLAKSAEIARLQGLVAQAPRSDEVLRK